MSQMPEEEHLKRTTFSPSSTLPATSDAVILNNFTWPPVPVLTVDPGSSFGPAFLSPYSLRSSTTTSTNCKNYDSDHESAFSGNTPQQQQQLLKRPFSSEDYMLEKRMTDLNMLFSPSTPPSTSSSPSVTEASLMRTPDKTPTPYMASGSLGFQNHSEVPKMPIVFPTNDLASSLSLLSNPAFSLRQAPGGPVGEMTSLLSDGKDMIWRPQYPASASTSTIHDVSWNTGGGLCLTPTGSSSDNTVRINTSSAPAPISTRPIQDLIQQNEKYMEMLEEIDRNSSSSNRPVLSSPLLTSNSQMNQQPQHQNYQHQPKTQQVPLERKFFSMHPQVYPTGARESQRQNHFSIAGTTSNFVRDSNPYSRLIHQASLTAVASFGSSASQEQHPFKGRPSTSSHLQPIRRNSFHTSYSTSPTFRTTPPIRASTAEPNPALKSALSANSSPTKSRSRLPQNLPPDHVGFVNVVFVHPPRHLKQRRRNLDEDGKHRNPLWWYDDETPNPIEIMDEMFEDVGGDWPARKPLKVEEVPVPTPNVVAFKVSRWRSCSIP
ncbi:hypothetical protein HDU97_008673 [Phlyctochytrium planicorne]|nr:hypothetical protein HDU97_008673 [Phlyctochytrium planicorne]